MARGGPKVTLDVYPALDEAGVRTGKYGLRLWIGPTQKAIPAAFKPILVAGSTLGYSGSGVVEGTVFLKFGGSLADYPDGLPPELAELNGQAVHAVKWSGPGGMTVPMDFMVALADTMMPVELYSKDWVAANAAAGGVVLDMTDPAHPYADVDADGILNWMDPNQSDGPGWEVGSGEPEEPVTPETDGSGDGGSDGSEDPHGSVIGS